MKKAMKQSTMVSILNAVSGLLLISITVVFFLSVYYNRRIDDSNQVRFDLTYNANMFLNGSKTLTDEVRAYAVTGNQVHYDNYWDEVNNKKNRDIGVDNLRKIGITKEEEEFITQMSSISNQLIPLEEKSMEFVKNGEMQAAVEKVYSEKYETAIYEINRLKSEFLKTLDNRAMGEVKHLESVCVMLSWVIVILTVLLLVIQGIQNLWVKKKLLNPILTIEEEMQQISQGNLTSNFDLEPDTSEIGLLIASIHTTKEQLTKYIDDISAQLSEMAKGNMDLTQTIEYIGDFSPIQKSLEVILNSLNETLSQIDDAATQVDTHSDQVSSGSQALAQGATEQASTVQELSSNINLLTEQMRDIAKNAELAKGSTQQASESLNLSNTKMLEMQNAMNEISNASTEISKIIKTIEDIAFQTNILALNAAVEAARAGTAGKGFAVVADEVRNLANKSQEASRHTAELIENSTKAVAQGVALTEDTVQALNMVIEKAQESTGYVETIATESEEQAESLNQVNIGVGQISDVVQTNAATAEQSAAASEELSAQSSQLKQLVNAFNLRSNSF